MKQNWLLITAMMYFMIVIAARAYMMPITHDEVATWYHIHTINLFSCLSNPACWDTANTHWLNSLLAQWSQGLFGNEAWALRLPNILAGWAYVICASFIGLRYITRYSLQLAGFLLLCAHPYLLDFFSLARGYGMMAAGIMWGIYGMLRYIENYKTSWLLVAILSLFFSILSNFTALMPWAALGAGWLIWMILHRRTNLLLKHGAYWLASALLLSVLLYYPIKTLAALGEFKWGVTGVVATGVDLMENLIYGARYFGQKSSAWLLAILLFLVSVVITSALFFQKKEIKHPVLFTGLILFLNILFIVLNQIITGVYAPAGRKSIYLIPFIFCIPALGLEYIRNKTLGIIAGYIISVILVFHLLKSLNFKSNREWFSDAYYPALFAAILPEGPASDSVQLSSSWIFQPGLYFYQRTTPLPIGGLPYQRPLVIDSMMDYYYVEPQDTVGMSNAGFVYERMIGPFYLYRNRAKADK